MLRELGQLAGVSLVVGVTLLVRLLVLLLSVDSRLVVTVPSVAVRIPHNFLTTPTVFQQLILTTEESAAPTFKAPPLTSYTVQNCMVSKKFKELRRKISGHYYNEAELMVKLTESNLSEKEMILLREFMLTHPYAKVGEYN
jgi:hypothetical protein